MKSKLLICRCALVLLSMLFIFTACAQEPKKKLNIIASARTENIEYKSLPENNARAEAQTQKAVQKPTPEKKIVKEKKTQQNKDKQAAKQKQKNVKTAQMKLKKKAAKQTTKKKSGVNPEKKKRILPQQKDSKKGKKATLSNKRKKAKESVMERYIALKANLPMSVLSIQNLGVEVQLHKNVTVDFPVMWSISDIEREHAIRGIAFQPEGRWWMKEAGKGHFFGLHAHFAWFNLKWKEDRYQTEKRPLMGAGISYGYKLPISKHWGAEFNIGAGYASIEYDTYYNIENGAWINKRIRNYWGITRLGLSLVYRF